MRVVVLLMLCLAAVAGRAEEAALAASPTAASLAQPQALTAAAAAAPELPQAITSAAMAAPELPQAITAAAETVLPQAEEAEEEQEEFQAQAPETESPLGTAVLGFIGGGLVGSVVAYSTSVEADSRFDWKGFHQKWPLYGGCGAVVGATMGWVFGGMEPPTARPPQPKSKEASAAPVVTACLAPGGAAVNLGWSW